MAIYICSNMVFKLYVSLRSFLRFGELNLLNSTDCTAGRLKFCTRHHDVYKFKTHSNPSKTLALIELFSPVQRSYEIFPACVPSSELTSSYLHRSSVVLIASGWGTIAKLSRMPDMRQTRTDIVPCGERKQEEMNDVICVREPVDSRGRCVVDSGGALLAPVKTRIADDVYFDLISVLGIETGGRKMEQCSPNGLREFIFVPKHVDWVMNVTTRNN
ncbi:unnamed protein product [Notodromas monacha]|uniref:Peptidase S1 domain-containing protein n=1 Tax=Notodromas monacha TaxID=399045 RepID=A0A7R9G9D5_9CRUS|nr:unnamed protein product [Notodromas monacha]CAG0912754.1 unnamed protein product [Notodromas monacha]